jgi:hypothetical protein
VRLKRIKQDHTAAKHSYPVAIFDRRYLSELSRAIG